MNGTIMKGIGGFYYVDTGDRTFECKARGLFRKDGIIPMVGDRVEMEVLNEDEGRIREILPRNNYFDRPPVSNVDCLVLVAAVTRPAPNPDVMDKLLIMGEKKQTEIILCLNKIDETEDSREDWLREVYRDLYPVAAVSSLTGRGIPELRQMLRGKQSALAGPSGVGKSTLLNCLLERNQAETGEISAKSKRGKHTTRHAELFELPGGGWIFDTPGFTSFELSADTDAEELAECYPEMRPFAGQCRYDDCYHLSEPDCRIREAVEAGQIHKRRYESYKARMEEIRGRKKY